MYIKRGSAENLALTVLEGSVDGLRHQGRPKRQWMDDIEEWSGCSYIQLKEMSQDRVQWRRQTIEWSSAVANRHRRWSTSEWVTSKGKVWREGGEYPSKEIAGVPSRWYVINLQLIKGSCIAILRTTSLRCEMTVILYAHGCLSNWFGFFIE